MLARFADNIHHTRLLVFTAVQSPGVPRVMEIRLLDAALLCTMPGGHIDHSIQLVLPAVLTITGSRVIAGRVLGTSIHQALPFAIVDVHHPFLLMRSAVKGVRGSLMIEVRVFLATVYAAKLVDHIYHSRAFVCSAEETKSLAWIAEVRPSATLAKLAALFCSNHRSGDGLKCTEHKAVLRIPPKQWFRIATCHKCSNPSDDVLHADFHTSASYWQEYRCHCTS